MSTPETTTRKFRLKPSITDEQLNEIGIHLPENIAHLRSQVLTAHSFKTCDFGPKVGRNADSVCVDFLWFNIPLSYLDEVTDGEPIKTEPTTVDELKESLRQATETIDRYERALYECLVASGEEIGGMDDFYAMTTPEKTVPDAVRDLRKDRDELGDELVEKSQRLADLQSLFSVRDAEASASSARWFRQERAYHLMRDVVERIRPDDPLHKKASAALTRVTRMFENND